MTGIDRKGARLSDVAEAAGVSKATVSNVFNKPGLVSAEVRGRVLAAAKAIGYAGPDPRGRMLSAGRVNAIGVATAEPLAYFFTDPFAREMMAGITRACDASGVGLSLISAGEGGDEAWNIRTALVDGLILFCLEDAGRLIASSRERRLPFVTLALDDGDEAVSAIGIDEAEGARLAARHLADLGHRRVAVLAMEFSDTDFGDPTIPASEARIAASDYAASRERVRGYRAGLAEAGVAADAVPVFETPDAPAVAAALAAAFATPDPPTALLAQSDRIAMAALDWLRGHGMAVPDAVSVVGFDGVPEAAATDPPLTTVSQPIAEIGSRAVRVILDHPHEIRREVMPVDLVVRESTGAPAPR